MRPELFLEPEEAVKLKMAPEKQKKGETSAERIGFVGSGGCA